jgi:hypothetical protein
MRPLALASLASASLLLPAREAHAQADARGQSAPPCYVTVIHALKAEGRALPALKPYAPLLSAKAYKKWKSFALVSQARYRLPPGGKALLAAAKEPLEFSVLSRDGDATRATLMAGKRKPLPFSLSATAPAQLVDGGPWQGGQLLYGVYCPAGQ